MQSFSVPAPGLDGSSFRPQRHVGKISRQSIEMEGRARYQQSDSLLTLVFAEDVLAFAHLVLLLMLCFLNPEPRTRCFGLSFEKQRIQSIRCL
jgi:hypothetical protein